MQRNSGSQVFIRETTVEMWLAGFLFSFLNKSQNNGISWICLPGISLKLGLMCRRKGTSLLFFSRENCCAILCSQNMKFVKYKLPEQQMILQRRRRYWYCKFKVQASNGIAKEEEGILIIQGSRQGSLSAGKATSSYAPTPPMFSFPVNPAQCHGNTHLAPILYKARLHHCSHQHHRSDLNMWLPIIGWSLKQQLTT